MKFTFHCRLQYTSHSILPTEEKFMRQQVYYDYNTVI